MSLDKPENFIEYIYGRVKTRPYYVLIPISIVLLFYRLQYPAMWGDEFYTLKVIRFTIPELVETLRGDYHPPLYFILTKWWCSLFGFTDIGMRSLSSLFGLLGIVVSLIIYRRYYTELSYWFISFLIVIHPTLVLYFRMGRYYSMLYLLSSISYLFLFEILKTGRKTGWFTYALYAFFSIMLLYTSNMGWFVLFSQVLWMLFIDKPGKKKPVIVTFAVIGVAYLPWLGTLLKQIGMSRGALPYDFASNSLLDILSKALYPLYSFTISETIYPWTYYLVIPLVIILLWRFGRLLYSSEKRKWLFTFFITIIIPVFMLLVVSELLLQRLSFIFFPARLIFFVLFVPPLIAGLLDNLPAYFKRFSLIFIVFIFLYASYNYFFSYKMINPGFNLPMREAAEDFREETDGQQLIITNIYQPFYYFGEDNTYYDFHWMLRDFSGKDFPASMWFLMKSTGQIDFKAQTDVFIDSLVNSGAYAKTFENGYSRFDDKTLEWFQKALGKKLYPYRLSLINIKNRL
ncbi:MAG: hypothetical protein GF307_14600 [candidate division Zixibacteria bacterium]|nr:hypothetical protein [candidate division Zixibacteria bacterium]